MNSSTLQTLLWPVVTPVPTLSGRNGGPLDEGPCPRWAQPQHVLFQLANVCFCVSYLAPNGKFGLLFMHGLLILGFMLFSAWAWIIVCAPEVFSWNFGFTLLNLGQSLHLLYTMRKVKLPEELEDVYRCMFHPLKVSRPMFKKLVCCEYSQIMSLHPGEAYAMQNLTKTDRLGLLITGKVNVISDQHFLHNIQPKEFLDSPEFECSRAGVEEKFKVSIIAAAPCKYIFWQRQNLEYLLIKEGYLANVLSLLLSRDITTKLYAMNDKIVTEKGSHLDIRLPSLTGSIVSHTTTQDSGRSPQRGHSQRNLQSSSLLPNSISNDMYKDCDMEDSVFDSKEKYPGDIPSANGHRPHREDASILVAP